MFTLRIFILFVYLNVRTDSQDIQVVGSGVTRLQRNDMIMVFYVTVEHFGKKPRRAMATSVECCETVAEDDNDCDLIDLYGGDFGVIHPGSQTNLTFIYPSLYGYNRRGHCLVKVLHRDLECPEIFEVQHRIDFDTRLTPDTVPHNLRGFYNPESFVPCETPDLDPLDHCNPVDCHLKYAGYRNYYNRRVKMCQRVPTCITDPNKDLPDVAYIPTSNTCWNLEKSATKEDIEKLTRGEIKPKTDQMVNIRCHHGEIDPRTGLCVCDYGWKSEPFSADTNSGRSYYSMCTIKCRVDDPYEYLPFWMGLILGVWFLFFVSLCEWHNVFNVRRAGKRSSRNHALREIYKSFKGCGVSCETPPRMELLSAGNPAARNIFGNT